MKLLFTLLILPILGLYGNTYSPKPYGVDVVIALEQSGEVYDEVFDKMKDVAKTIVKRFTIGKEKGQIRLLVVTFDEGMKKIGTWLDSKQTDAEIDTLFKEIRYSEVFELPNLSKANAEIKTELDRVRRGARNGVDGYRGLIVYFASGRDSAPLQFGKEKRKTDSFVKNVEKKLHSEGRYFNAYTLRVDEYKYGDGVSHAYLNNILGALQPLSDYENVVIGIKKRILSQCFYRFQPATDLVILVETADYHLFKSVKNYVKDFVRQLKICPKNYQVALVSYGYTVFRDITEGFNSKHTRTKCSLKEFIKEYLYADHHFKTMDIAAAINYATDNMFKSGSGRNATKVQILFSQSLTTAPTNKTKEALRKAKTNGIHTLLVSYGQETNHPHEEYYNFVDVENVRSYNGADLESYAGTGRDEQILKQKRMVDAICQYGADYRHISEY